MLNVFSQTSHNVPESNGKHAVAVDIHPIPIQYGMISWLKNVKAILMKFGIHIDND